jgi:AraC-like DNA-binding protein
MFVISYARHCGTYRLIGFHSKRSLKEEIMGALQSPAFISETVWKRALYFSCTRRIVDHLSAHSDQDVRLQNMAEIACMEKTAFSRSFKRKTGLTVHEFVQAFRISKAAEKMMSSDYSITEIALEVGFGSLATFERTFKKIVGATPSTYRWEILRRNGILHRDA